MIKLENVSKSFGTKKIIESINLTIEHGEVTFIVGSSGAGKSTLLNLIGGLDNVSGGRILYNGDDITDNLNEYRAHRVGFIFQDFNLVSGLPVKKNVELGLLYAGKESADIDSDLKRFGIKDNRQPVETLSGGEKQRVAIIRSICKNSEIVIADEPTGNLDSENAKLVFEQIVNMKTGKHIVIVSHDIEMARKYGDRIITLSDGKIISDERLHTAETIENTPVSADKEAASRKKLAPVLMVGLNSIRMRKSKIFSIALVISLAISMIALLLDFNSQGNNISRNVNVNYLESDLISVFYPSTANLGYKETPFTSEKISYIQDEYDLKECVQMYIEQDNWIFNNGNSSCEGSVKQINLDDFFEERIMSYEIEGQFPQNNNEIIIAKDVADTLFTENCIGKEIGISDGMGGSITCTIVGINSTVNPYDNIYTVVCADKIKEMYERRMLETLYQRVELLEYQEENSEGTMVNCGGIYGGLSEIDGNAECLVGKLPQKADEIIISRGVLNYALDAFEVKGDNLQNQIKNLSEVKMALIHNGVHEVYITGVYDSENIEIMGMPELISELKNVNPTVLECYVSENADVASVRNNIDKNEEFTCSLQLENLKNNIAKQTGYFKLALIVLGIIMMIVSVSMLASFSKIVVLERRKEIAILKSLGANNGDIRNVLWFDSVVISMLGFVLALVFSKICITVIPYFVKDLSIINLKFPLGRLLILGVIFLIFICMYTLVGMQQLVKKTPAELFKE